MKKKNKKKPKSTQYYDTDSLKKIKIKKSHVMCAKIKWTGRSGRPKIESFTPNQFADRKDILY